MSVDHYFDGLMVMGPRSLGSGKSAYDYAVEGGYTGTETEFALRMAFLMNGTVVGYMEGSTVVLSGSLTPGTYTFAYALRKSDGTTETAVIGTYTVEDEPEAPTYTVTFVADGVTVDRVTYTEGDTELSRIPDVPVKDGYTGVWEEYTLNGNLTVNAVYTKIEVDPAYTNLLESAGYTANKKISVSSGDLSGATGAYASGFIPIKSVDNRFYMKNITLASAASVNNIVFYNADKTKINGAAGTAGAFTSNIQYDSNAGVYHFKPSAWANNGSAAFFRFSCGGITDESIVTENEQP